HLSSVFVDRELVFIRRHGSTYRSSVALPDSPLDLVARAPAWLAKHAPERLPALAAGALRLSGYAICWADAGPARTGWSTGAATTREVLGDESAERRHAGLSLCI